MENITISKNTLSTLKTLQKIKDLTKEIEHTVRDYCDNKYGTANGKVFAELLLNRANTNGSRVPGEELGLTWYFQAIEEEFLNQELVRDMSNKIFEQSTIKTI